MAGTKIDGKAISQSVKERVKKGGGGAKKTGHQSLSGHNPSRRESSICHIC